MKYPKQKQEVILIIALAVIFNVSMISSQTLIGLSPGALSFSEVLRGGYSEKTIVLSANTDSEVEVTATYEGEIKSWVNVSEKSFFLKDGVPYQIRVIIMPPSDLPNGNYTGYVRFTTSSFGEAIPEEAVGKVLAYLDLLINVEIVDTEVVRCRALNYGISSVEKGDDLVLKIDFANDGNIRLAPKVNAVLWDEEQISIVDEYSFDSKPVLPTLEDKLSFRLPSDFLDSGQYWIEVSVPDCYSTEILTFDVLEPGTLSAKGELMGIVLPKVGNVSETIPFSVKFRNTGQKELTARFVGKVNLGKEIVQVIETPDTLVPIGESYSFDSYFVPKKQGKYTVSGRVFYNGKRTFESSSVIEIFGSWINVNLKTILLSLAYIVIGLMIFIFIYKIRKERKIYSNKIRGLRIK
jgi:hypothetical protein